MKVLKTLVLLGSALSLVGCENYTTTEMCAGADLSQITLSGTYSMSQQNQNFEVSTKLVEFVIDGGAIKRSDSEVVGKVCTINGMTVTEYPGEDGGFGQNQLLVNDSGFTEIPLMYDRPSLEADGISTEVVVKEPESVPALLRSLKNTFAGKDFTQLEEEEGSSSKLVIHTEGHAPSKVLKSAFRSSFGLAYFRQN